jgi:hypothetical protein
MLLAYLTTDEVNWDAITRLAEAHGVVVFAMSFQDPPPDGRFDAVLYDWDFIPPEQRQDIIKNRFVASSALPIAVHSYGICEEEEKLLQEKGVATFRRLGTKLLRFLKSNGRGKEPIPFLLGG